MKRIFQLLLLMLTANALADASSEEGYHKIRGQGNTCDPKEIDTQFVIPKGTPVCYDKKKFIQFYNAIIDNGGRYSEYMAKQYGCGTLPYMDAITILERDGHAVMYAHTVVNALKKNVTSYIWTRDDLLVSCEQYLKERM